MNKAKEISVLWSQIKPQIGELVRLCHEVESHYEVTADAYQRGYETAKHECENCPKQAYTDALKMESYQKGLSDAWEAARKVVALSTVDRRKVFGSEYMYSILEKHTASEAIAEIQEYEQEKKDGVWIAIKANEPSVDTTLKCSKCGYVIKIKPHETSALNFCPKCGDCKKP